MKTFFAYLLLFASGPLSAQTMSLADCIERALKSNQEVLSAELTAEQNRINWQGARTALLPDLNASASSGINTGRSIDPFTNDFINQQVKFSSYGVSSNLILFNGFSLHNTVKQNRQIFQAAVLESEQLKDDVAIDVSLAYFQALSSEDLMYQSEQQAALSRQQVERLETMNREGAISPYLLSDLRGQYASDQLAYINARNNWKLARIELFRLMNVHFDESVKLERLDSAMLDMVPAQNADSIYESAVDRLPMVKAATLRASGALAGWKAARGQLLPVLSFGAAGNTNYSSAAGIKYGSQLDNNLFTSLSVSLSIPILNGFAARNRMKLAGIFYRNAALLNNTTKTRLQQAIEEAHAQLEAASERYSTLNEQVAAYRESFRSATIRFNEGVINSVEYLTAKNNLDRANISLIGARYDYLLRKKIIGYYQGERIR